MSQYLADAISSVMLKAQIKTGDGCYLYDTAGRRYLDFVAGWCVANVGYNRNEIIEAIKKEAETGVYIPAFLQSAKWEELARLLCEIAPGKMRRAFRCTSGSEAVDFAIRCARAAAKKTTIVSIDDVYHGHTYGAVSVGSAGRKITGPCVPGFIKLPMPNNQNYKKVIVQFEALAKKGKIAAFLSEPVWSNSGVYIPPKEFYPAIQKICRRHDILLIMDEVATGFGRCGKLFASELWKLQPDIICLAKGLTGGYGAAGAMLTTEQVFQKSRGIPAYSTFGWAYLETAAMLANVKLILKEKLWQKAQKTGSYLLEQLQKLEKYPIVKEARGIGLLLGIEFKQPVVPTVIQKCVKQGLITSDASDTILFLSPPLILDEQMANEGGKILEKVIIGLK